MASRLALALVVAAAWMSSGCSVVTLARGGGGPDVTSVQPGVSRPAAEALLGPPVKEWRSPTGIRYAAYDYDTGRAPDISQAVAAAFLDVFTAGVFELVELIRGYPVTKASLGPPTRAGVVVAYDDHDLILGVFDEFDALPADGRSAPRTWRR